MNIFKHEIAKTNLNDLMSVECIMSNLLLYGRYCKFSREVSQTPWNLASKPMHSVQSLIADPLLPLFGSSLAYLHAAGREDIDVRMLGQGRPFIMEFVNPKRALSVGTQIEQMQALTKNEWVYCHQFKLVDRSFFDSLKEIETSKAKSYSCLVWVKRRITPQDCETLSATVKEL